MQKILLLGGSAQQIVAIQKAKELGFYTVLCDYLPDNPGQFVSDKFYLISTTDKEAVLQIAKTEQIDGVLAYASDPAAPTAAYVAEKLGLRTNPYESVEILCNKDKFRSFLLRNDFCTPQADGYKSAEEALTNIKKYRLPIIIKPVDSSGSKGATVLHSLENIEKAVDFAFSYSRSHRIIIEEFIEKKHPYLVGGDIFVLDGKVILWGLMNCHRDYSVNALVPVGKSYPLELCQEDIENIKSTLQSLVDKLHIQCGAMNVELVIDQNNNVWPIDVGPRNGGNMIPDLLGYIFGIDVVEMSVKAAMDMPFDAEIHEGKLFYATHNLHTDKSGKLKEIIFEPQLEQYIIKKCIYKKSGDFVEYFDNAAKALGIIFMKFDSKEKMAQVLANITKYIHVILQEE